MRTRLGFSAMLLALAPKLQNQPLDEDTKTIMLVSLIGGTLVFGGLGFWALFSPLIPSMLGLVIYLADTAVFVANAPQMWQGLIIRFVIISGLGRAVAKSLQAR